MSIQALHTAAAEEGKPPRRVTPEARDSATLEILVKALMAGLAATLTARFGAQAAVAAAVLATLAAEGARQFVKRRRWGVKRVGFLVALTVAFGSIDSTVARGARKVFGHGSRVPHLFAGGAGQVALTTVAATTIAVSAVVTVPDLVDRGAHLSGAAAVIDERTFDFSSGEIGKLTFDADSGERVFVEMTDSTTGTTTLTLESPGGESLDSTYAYPYLDTTALPGSGTYRAIVDPWGTNSGQATIRVLRVPPDVVETVHLSETTKPVTVSTVIGQNAEVRFEGTAGERVFVEMTDSTMGTTTLTLESPGGESLASTYAYGYLNALTLPEDGRYRVVVDPWGTNTGRVAIRVAPVGGSASRR